MTGQLEDWDYGVTPDPKRFLVARVQEEAQSSSLMVVTNWFDELRRKAPVK